MLIVLLGTDEKLNLKTDRKLVITRLTNELLMNIYYCIANVN